MKPICFEIGKTYLSFMANVAIEFIAGVENATII